MRGLVVAVAYAAVIAAAAGKSMRLPAAVALAVATVALGSMIP